MMTVNRGAAGFRANLVKLVAELPHLGCLVLVPGDDLVDGVDDDRIKVQVTNTADEFWHKLVERNGMSAQIPDDDVFRFVHRQMKGIVNFEEAGDAACRINFEIDIQYPPLAASEPQPRDSLGDGDAKLHEEKRLSCLGRSGNEHLMPAPQDSVDQLFGEQRWIVLVRREWGHRWKFIRHALHEIHPVRP